MNFLRVCLFGFVGVAAAVAEDAPRNAAEAARRVILPKVHFQDTSLREAVSYFETMARKIAKPATRLNIILAIPPGARPAISLRREGATLLAALEETAALAGCEVQGEAHGLVIREKGAPPLPAIVAGEGVDLEQMRKRLDEIVLDRISIREATMREVMEFTMAKAKQLDPAGGGVSMVLKLDDQGAPNVAPGAVPGIPGLENEPGAGKLAPPPGPFDQQAGRISIEATNIPLLEFLRYAAGVMDLKVSIEKFAILITPREKK